MQEIGSFISDINNLLLIILWFVLLYMIINSFIKAQWDRSPQEIVQLMNSDSSVVLDVREDNELQSGVIADSIHIPMGQVKKRINELEKYKNNNVLLKQTLASYSSLILAIIFDNQMFTDNFSFLEFELARTSPFKNYHSQLMAKYAKQ